MHELTRKSASGQPLDPVKGKPAPPRRLTMTYRTLKSTLPATILALAVAGQSAAQSPLTDPAPGNQVQPGIPLQTPQQKADPVEQEVNPAEQNFGQTDVTATDIIRELAPVESGTVGAPVIVETPNGSVTIDSTRAIDLTVFFAYDSARLLPEARTQLDALGYALNSPELRQFSYLIAGHTDAAGPADYNLDLSIRRAIAVAEYLIRYHGISPNRLVAHGWGESRLSVPSDPGSGANRRVEVSLILPSYGSLYFPSYEHVMPANGTGGVLYYEEYPTRVWVPGGDHGLTDPRWRLSAYALDDFGATPTYLRRW
jgi:OmpA-OmpF porin, OOP family